MYILIYIYKGELPWEYLGAKYTKTKKYEKTKNLMCDININTFVR